MFVGLLRLSIFKRLKRYLLLLLYVMIMPLFMILLFAFKGIGGLEDYIRKSATLSNTTACPAFTDMYQEVTPIVRVSVVPRNGGK